MSRWRAPAPVSSPYITATGYRALEAELQRLGVRRVDTVKHLAAAAAEGDRSENAEYIYRKKELREIDRRLGYLQRRMPKLTIVARAPVSKERVFLAHGLNWKMPQARVHAIALWAVTSLLRAMSTSALMRRLPRHCSNIPWMSKLWCAPRAARCATRSSLSITKNDPPETQGPGPLVRLLPDADLR